MAVAKEPVHFKSSKNEAKGKEKGSGLWSNVF